MNINDLPPALLAKTPRCGVDVDDLFALRDLGVGRKTGEKSGVPSTLQ
jgi:hypothetical protein